MYLDSRFFYFGIGHLGCYRALPYQSVQFFLLCRAVDSVLVDGCGTDCLVSFLGTLGVGVIFSYFQILLAKLVGDFAGNCIYGEFRQIERVGTHVSYVSLLI